ncbi:MAG: methionine--tRNA ligase subunit beta [Candidatus Liptonbacteria bacterium]|nr:methionine--tRNA ligase subunit beta [Candidatus Liptonbacteria bacterium]
MITFDDFKKLDIRIGKVLSAEKIPDSDKLVKLIIDIGGEERQVVAGIAESYPDPTALAGKEVPVIVNLEPRKLKGHMSEGMILAADADGHPVLLHPDREIPPGSIIR